jgi:hypothetical protein
MAATTNKWLKVKKTNDILKRLDEAFMNGWANDATLGEVMGTLPKDLREFVLKLKFNTPIMDDSQISLTLNIED